MFYKNLTKISCLLFLSILNKNIMLFLDVQKLNMLIVYNTFYDLKVDFLTLNRQKRV